MTLEHSLKISGHNIRFPQMTLDLSLKVVFKVDLLDSGHNNRFPQMALELTLKRVLKVGLLLD